MICRALRDYGIEAPIDVHLMVEPVDRIIPDFARAGASYITFHPEASRHIDRSLALIRDEGCKAGLVFNPATPLTWLEHVIFELDMVLIMSVNPGFGGQKFIPSALDKLAEVVAEQGGNANVVLNRSLLPRADSTHQVEARVGGGRVDLVHQRDLEPGADAADDGVLDRRTGRGRVLRHAARGNELRGSGSGLAGVHGQGSEWRGAGRVQRDRGRRGTCRL